MLLERNVSPSFLRSSPLIEIGLPRNEMQKRDRVPQAQALQVFTDTPCVGEHIPIHYTPCQLAKRRPGVIQKPNRKIMCFHIIAGQQLGTKKHHPPLFAIHGPDDIGLPFKCDSPFGDA